MLRRSPEGIEDFSPIWSEAECGVKGDSVREVLQGRPNNLYVILSIIVYNLYRIRKPHISLRCMWG
ncbi:hypothetical protein Barb6_01716 [Bacteroidales bacterium Barb6]|nr:hypothetical protein Barb6_01716 [Bacteroidales bacterium Barb6]